MIKVLFSMRNGDEFTTTSPSDDDLETIRDAVRSGQGSIIIPQSFQDGEQSETILRVNQISSAQIITYDGDE